MSEARDLFLAHVANPDADETVGELRKSLSRAKLETLDQVEGLDEGGLALVMPGLYQQIVTTTIQIAAHVGLGVCLALEAYDEQESGASISTFARPVRQQMTETGVAMKRRHSSRIAKLVAEVEAQRLAWRHNHEFLSWLAFRRGDERYPAADRRERILAFKVMQRLLQSREAVTKILGEPLCVALEAHDRFLLTNRWRLEPGDEHAVERLAWPILSYQPARIVELEIARYDFDAAEAEGQDAQKLADAKVDMLDMMREQFAHALDFMPDGTMGRVV